MRFTRASSTSVDPRIVATARRIPAISYEEMMEMAACGAKVLQLRCVEYARRYDMPSERPACEIEPVSPIASSSLTLPGPSARSGPKSTRTVSLTPVIVTPDISSPPDFDLESAACRSLRQCGLWRSGHNRRSGSDQASIAPTPVNAAMVRKAARKASPISA